MQAPLHVLEQHPGLADLIADLNNRFITPAGLSVELEQELQQARHSLQHKQSLIETKTIFEPIDRLRFLPLDNHQQHENQALLSNRAVDLQRQAASHIDHIINVLETRRLLIHDNDRKTFRPNDSLLFSRSSRGLIDGTSGSRSRKNDDTSTTIFDVLASRDVAQNNQEQDGNGLDGFTLEQLRPPLKALDGFSKPMMDTIMDLIRQRAQDVVAHVDHSSTEHTIGEQKRRHHVLPVERSFADVISHTKEDVSLLDRIKEKVMLQELTIHNQVLELFDTLHQTILVLWEILTEFMVRYQLERDQTFKEYFAQVIDSLVLKLEVLKGSLQQEVYDKDTNRRLSQVRDTLERMQQNLEAQTKHNVALLQQYKGAGQEFNMIVDAYTKIMYRIEVVQDDVQRLSLDMK